MSTRTFIILMLTLLAVASAKARRDSAVGHYKPIKNLTDPYVVDIADFAVHEHNKQKKDDLQVVKIVKGESEVVSGTNYRLTIAANDSKQYEAVVYDKPWAHVRKLVTFRGV